MDTSQSPTTGSMYNLSPSPQNRPASALTPSCFGAIAVQDSTSAFTATGLCHELPGKITSKAQPPYNKTTAAEADFNFSFFSHIQYTLGNPGGFKGAKFIWPAPRSMYTTLTIVI